MIWRWMIFVLILTATACQKQESGQSTAGPMDSQSEWSTTNVRSSVNPVTGEWSLTAIDQNPLSSGSSPTLVFEPDGRCRGSTGVNKFNAVANFEKLTEGWLSIGPASVTRMAGPSEAMVLERLFLERLENVSTFKVEGDTLHMYAGKQEAVTFHRIYR